jgi:hypothetical protein
MTGEYAFWLKGYSTRERERQRAKIAQRTKVRFYPTPFQIYDFIRSAGGL